MKFLQALAFLIISILLVSCLGQGKRTSISLDGKWKIAEGSMDRIPGSFDREIMVPGLVTMASPAFINCAPRVRNRGDLVQKDTLREAYWYMRHFKIRGRIPEVARLKVSKAMFGTKVFINGNDAGEHLPSFTPGWFGIQPFLKRGDNEIIIRVGSCRNSLPRSMPDGFDFEKERYIPGMFDDVLLEMSGSPAIYNIQTAPMIDKKTVVVQVTLGKLKKQGKIHISYKITEAASGNDVGGAGEEYQVPEQDSPEHIITAEIPVENCRLWSPEDPFLYKVTVSTGGDEKTVRFGMRELKLDTVSGRTLLNGKPYFMRGSNVTLYRFFEDDSCRDLPWNPAWVRDLHRSFRNFHWNTLRYCIGIAPGRWYDIADEEGFMIQDEFPVWYGGKGWCSWPRELKSDELAREYKEWMQEQWNHPSVVIWDASNETLTNDGRTEEIADAIRQVRKLDLSMRPWDNSYSTVRRTGDVMELHPYHFQDPHFRLACLEKASPDPGGDRGDKRYIKIVNEYGWLWLNRDGTPTTLTRELYLNLLGADSSVARRREVYAMYLAAETEFWRCHREATAVLHFTALGYSRKDGQTSDHFSNVKNLIYDNEFRKYMPDAFAPVGIMLDEWGSDVPAGKSHRFRILAINDLGQDWIGKIVLKLYRDGEVVAEKSITGLVPGFGQISDGIDLSVPDIEGRYTAVASLEKDGDKPVKSVRELPVVK
ncbi:MAG TPA: glycoside hydrolase family 2 TIM barrel-domain containing protein [Bacteroidales bacterium]|nr:glycoside hydrolase family 2 TIM barrel-domain containing protein [Bacteroidales bacterium]